MTHRLRVDWPRCRGRGLCHELLPDVVALDEWGYPLVLGQVPEAQLADAREAVRACPQSALRLVDPPSTPRRSTVPGAPAGRA